MSDDLIGKFLSASKAASHGVGDGIEGATTPVSDPPARPYMLDFVTLDGTRHAFPYAHLLRVKYAAGSGIKLWFATHTVTIRGRCLDALFDALAAHTAARVTALSERHDPGQAAEDDERPVVHRVDVRKVRHGRGG